MGSRWEVTRKQEAGGTIFRLTLGGWGRGETSGGAGGSRPPSLPKGGPHPRTTERWAASGWGCGRVDRPVISGGAEGGMGLGVRLPFDPPHGGWGVGVYEQKRCSGAGVQRWMGNGEPSDGAPRYAAKLRGGCGARCRGVGSGGRWKARRSGSRWGLSGGARRPPRTRWREQIGVDDDK